MSFALHQLTESGLDELARVWDDLSRLNFGHGLPETDDEMTQTDLDALIAGVISSSGRIDAAGLAEIRAVLSRGASSEALRDVLRRLAVIVSAW